MAILIDYDEYDTETTATGTYVQQTSATLVNPGKVVAYLALATGVVSQAASGQDNSILLYDNGSGSTWLTHEFAIRDVSNEYRTAPMMFVNAGVGTDWGVYHKSV